ncbi:MAG: thioredoxin domain-containing protein [Candidatus Schekmanbacteria bacterium]|nr:thioredoxin domain-containing protein [Candidatus Schekmanbacteria bacterium]
MRSRAKFALNILGCLIFFVLVNVMSTCFAEESFCSLTSPSKCSGTQLTIYEYSDFQCGYCAKVQPTVNKILSEYGDRIKFVYKQFPLPVFVHKDAMNASKASVAALKQGKFWEMHDLLFKDQRKLKMEDLLAYAGELNLDMEQFKKDMNSKEVLDMINAEIEEGKKLGVLATPNFIIGETSILGAKPYEVFKAAIDEALAKANKVENKIETKAEQSVQKLDVAK